MAAGARNHAAADLAGSRVLVVGLGRTGLAVAAFLRRAGARVTVNDLAEASGLGGAVDQARELGCDLVLGSHPPEVFVAADFIVVSPGVPLDLPALVAAADEKIPVIGELELACRYLRVPMVAITGTNGKTTTTELVGAMLRQAGRRVFVGGNIGNPLIDALEVQAELQAAVVEVSSFQLDTAPGLHPWVAVLLNISADHLDRYPDYGAYVASKCRIFANQGEDDIAVIPGEDPGISACKIPSRRLTFGFDSPTAAARVDDNVLTCTVPGGQEYQYDLSRWQLAGSHNLENLMAATLAATAAGASAAAIQHTIDTFQPRPHRLELVGTWRGIRIYNDSKATNVGAVAKSLANFREPVILIAGGRGKRGSYDPLAPLVREKVKCLILIGEERFNLAAALGSLTYTIVVERMEEAVGHALATARAGDVILLSPACASFDQYPNYEARGDHFRSLVAQLTAGNNASSMGFAREQTPGCHRRPLVPRRST